MQELPPHVKAYADALLAVAPPLTDEAKRASGRLSCTAMSPHLKVTAPNHRGPMVWSPVQGHAIVGEGAPDHGRRGLPNSIGSADGISR